MFFDWLTPCEQQQQICQHWSGQNDRRQPTTCLISELTIAV